MARKANRKRLQEIGRYVEQHPGSKPYDVAKGLDLAPSTVTRSLPALDEHDIFLSEDRKGGLWPFKR